jgi:hypothetical protein
VPERSSFIGAFLAHLPGTRFVDNPLRVVLEGVTEETGSDWSPRELALVVADYLAMLKSELRAEPYSKTKYRGQLRGRLPARSESSIEFKHANISSVFEQLGLPRIAGYAPRDNVQAALATEVTEHLAQDAELAELLAHHAGQALPEKKVQSFADHVDAEPPRRAAASGGAGAADRAPRTGSYGGSEAERRALGLAGEKWVLRLERLRLTEAGRSDLAARVRHVAVEVGDGLGYDIASFEIDEEPRLIEVKTTGAGANSQFFLSSNELAVSQREGDRYFLYRVYRFGTQHPRVYIAQGALEKSFELSPATFVVRPPRA